MPSPKPIYKLRGQVGETFLDQLLHSRGIVSESEKTAFLSPDYDLHTHDPFLLKDMQLVVDRIVQAVSANERILIYSDFDADGIPGAVVLHDFFKKISYQNFENFIPDRHIDGFGVHPHLLKRRYEESVADGNPIKLVITIDCGITDVAAGICAKELGFDLLITDHHTPAEVLPDVFAIINPKQTGCQYPEKMLCGAGVIFKVVQALCKDVRLNGAELIKEGWEKWLLDMVGIATLSDMVPLRGENRVFAYFGMMVLKKTRRVGLIKLFSSLRMDMRHLTEEDITFMVTPRINAASRMASPMDAFILLSTDDEVVADTTVKHLNKVNDSRKVQTALLVKAIKKELEKRDLSGKPVLVLGNPDWKHPLLGLVATHIVREVGIPVYLWGRVEEEGSTVIKGSCRAPDGMDAVSIMRAVPEGFFLNVGGHSAAGGFSISEDKIHDFENVLLKACEVLDKCVDGDERAGSAGSTEERGGVGDENGLVYIDKVAHTSEIGPEIWRHIEKLSPYGEANHKPTIMLKSVTVVDFKIFGKTKEHIELTLVHRDMAESAQADRADGDLSGVVYGAQQVERPIKAIQFFTANDESVTSKIKVGETITLIAHMEKSMFKRYPEYRLRIVDIM
jgi:single-stranded-DNA-specific exonuclease